MAAANDPADPGRACVLWQAALAHPALTHSRQLAVHEAGAGLALAELAVQRSQLALQRVQLVLHVPLHHTHIVR